jgi:tetratricopeptide (TPR) repeat protein
VTDPHVRAIELLEQAEEQTRPALLDEAIAILHNALRGRMDGRTRATHLSPLSTALELRGTLHDDPADIDAALAVARDAATTTDHDDADQVFYYLQSVRLLESRYQRSPRLPDIDEACGLLHAAAALPLVGHEERPLLLDLARMWHHRRFEHTHAIADLDSSVAYARASADANPADPERLLALCTMLQIRYDRTRSPADLAEIGTAARRVIDSMPPESEFHSAAVSELANAHRYNFLYTGDPHELDTAVDLLRAAWDKAAPDDDYLFGILGNLATTLLVRYGETAALSDAHDAYETTRAAMNLVPEADDDHGKLVANLAEAADALYERTNDARYLDEAVDLATQAARLMRGSPAVVDALTTLGFALIKRDDETVLAPRRFRFWRRRSSSTAVAVFRAALAACPDDHPGRAIALSNLGQALVHGKAEAPSADLKEAVTLTRSALRQGLGDSRDRARMYVVLARALVHLGAAKGKKNLLSEAMASYSTATEVPGAPTLVRLVAAHEWAGVTVRAGLGWQAARVPYAVAVDLLPVLAFRGAARPDNEHRLREHTGLTGDAASCATASGDPAGALALLERGRAVLWSDLLDLRTDLARLDVEAPELAARLRSLSTKLEGLTPPESWVR